MSSTYGNNIKLSIFGQSHSEAIGVVIDGIPAGERFDLDAVRKFLKRRAPGDGSFSTARKEADEPRILSGLLSGRSFQEIGVFEESEASDRFYYSCGAPICAVIQNGDTRSKDYKNLLDVPRPSHADFPAFVKYKSFHDIRGGGHFSGRLTAPLCFAGALCIQLLEKKGITVGAHIASIKGILDEAYDPVRLSPSVLRLAGSRDFPVNDAKQKEPMLCAIEAAKQNGDSVGGIIECGAAGLPAGLGEPMFGGVENRISQIVFGIPAVKGIEFGDGFSMAERYGSENNDAFCMAKENERPAVRTKTNHAGGILGGITSGMPLIFRAAIKPTASIAKEQTSVSLKGKSEETLRIHGRHDPCIVPRAVPCMEAALAIALYDLLRDAESEAFLKD